MKGRQKTPRLEEGHYPTDVPPAHLEQGRVGVYAVSLPLTDHDVPCSTLREVYHGSKLGSDTRCQKH
jgi:hypothetical protein